MIWEAFILMVGCTLATHLGLSEAVADVIHKIASCQMCLTFWCCLFALVVVLGYEPTISALLSLVMAYLSNWLAIVLGIFQRAYTRIYNMVYENNEENNRNE